MYNREYRQFSARKTIPAEGMQVKDTLKEKLEKYIQEYLGETVYVETPLITENKREIRFIIIFSKPQANPKGMDHLLDGIISLAISDIKIEGERLNSETLKKIIGTRLSKYKEGL